MGASETLHIAAAGGSTRLRDTIDRLGLGDQHYPKHLLPTGAPDGETVLGRIIRQATPPITRVIVHAHLNTDETIKRHPDIPLLAEVVLAPPDNSFFGPFLRALLAQGGLVLGASGDHYLDDSPWDGILAHHVSSPYPVTFAVARGLPVAGGLAYEIEDDGRIAGFKRKEWTGERDPINIGNYVFSGSREVYDSLAKQGITDHNSPQLRTTPEEIAGQLVADGLVGAYELPAFSAFNVNTPETYEALLKHVAASVGRAAIGL